MKRIKSILATALLAGLAVAAVSTPAVAYDFVTINEYDGGTSTWECENRCIVMGDGREQWVSDTQGGFVELYGRNPYVQWQAT